MIKVLKGLTIKSHFTKNNSWEIADSHELGGFKRIRFFYLDSDGEGFELILWRFLIFVVYPKKNYDNS